MTPLSPQRFALQLTIGQSTHDKLRRAQELLSHQIPSGDVAEVLDRALDALVRQLEKRKFAATGNPRLSRQRSTGKRYVPAAIKRAVSERDGGQCTFVSETGRRCSERRFLEFDHIDEVARGGRATVNGMRLRCRAHNQYGAECAFGAGFMAEKRKLSQRAAAESRAKAAETHAKAEAEARAPAAARQEKAREVIPWLRKLGYRADEARHAAALCESNPDATLEQRLRVALSYFRPKTISHGRAANGQASADHTMEGQ